MDYPSQEMLELQVLAIIKEMNSSLKVIAQELAGLNVQHKHILDNLKTIKRQMPVQEIKR